MTSNDEYFAVWEWTLEKNGYTSTIPVSEYFSLDLTEAHIMIPFWIDAGVIVRKDK